MTEQEFELQKQIWQLKNENTGLTVGIIITAILLLLLLAYFMYFNFTDSNK